MKENGWSADKRWGNEETDKLMVMYHKSHMIPSSMFDNVVEDWVAVPATAKGSSIVTKTPKETQPNKMLLLC